MAVWQDFEPAVWLYGRIVKRDHSNLSDFCMSNVKIPSALHRNLLVGGFKHFLFSIIYGMSSFPLTNIFRDGYLGVTWKLWQL